MIHRIEDANATGIPILLWANGDLGPADLELLAVHSREPLLQSFPHGRDVPL